MHRESIRSRLQQLVDTHTQAEIARRTAAAPPAIHRYLHGAKVPADFCAALVKEFGVNPAWLLSGEGAPYLSDVSAGTQRMAGDLLALVNAMNQVARMRLGSLVGKHHLKVLRELNDALSDFQRLRAKMDSHTTPMLRQVLNDYNNAVMVRKDLARARTLREVALQLSRMNSDEHLQWLLASLMSYHEYLAGNSDEGIRLQRRAFRMSMTADTHFTANDAREARGLALVLNQNGRRQEAASIIGAAVAMMSAVPELASELGSMRLLAAMLDIDRGIMRGSLEVVLSLFHTLPDKDRVLLGGAVLRALLLSGTVSLRGAQVVAPPGRGRALQVVHFALFSHDPVDLALAQEIAVGPADVAIPADSIAARTVAALLMPPRRRRPALQKLLAERVAERESAGSVLTKFSAAVHASRLAAEVHGPGRAVEFVLHAEQLRAALPPRVTPDILDAASHFRAAMQLQDAAPEAARLAEVGRQYFTQMTEAGYACFRHFARTAETAAIVALR